MGIWFSTAEHFRVMLYSVFIGIFLGVIYDVVKLSRVMLGISAYSETGKKLAQISLPLIKNRSSAAKPRRSSAFSVIMLFLGDIVFSLISAAVYSVFLFHAIRGLVRWYFLLASAAGFFLYYFTVSKIAMVAIEILFFGIKTVLRYIVFLLVLPIRLLCKTVLLLARIIYSRMICRLLSHISYNNRKRYTEKRRRNLDSELIIQEF